MIFNWAIRGDEEGEFTFTDARGDTVIYYVVGNREMKERILCMKIGDKIDSDHQLVEMMLGGKGWREGTESREESVERGLG